MEPITLALGLAKLIPSIASWFGGDDAQGAAEQVIDVAKQVTGLDDPDDAVAAIQSDPQLQIEFQKAMAPVIIARYEAEARQIDAINTTIRSELTSKSKFKSGWRPAFGWAVVFTWALQMIAVSCVIVIDTESASKIISAMAALGFMWSTALAVLGINITKRSHDKQVAAGQNPAGVITALIQRFTRETDG